MKLTDTQRDQWVEIYQQYRRAGHGPVYAAGIATGIVVDGLPF
jgi:hypothetical protein